MRLPNLDRIKTTDGSHSGRAAEPGARHLGNSTPNLRIAFSMGALSTLSEANRLRHAMHERRWQTVDAVFLITLWAAMALAFDFALPMRNERCATSIVVFAWPALVAEVERRGKTIIWLGLAACCVVSLTWSSSRLPKSYTGATTVLVDELDAGHHLIMPVLRSSIGIRLLLCCDH
jgi:hypothetical protein